MCVGYVARDRLNMGRSPIPLSVGSWPSWGARCEFLPDMPCISSGILRLVLQVAAYLGVS